MLERNDHLMNEARLLLIQNSSASNQNRPSHASTGVTRVRTHHLRSTLIQVQRRHQLKDYLLEHFIGAI